MVPHILDNVAELARRIAANIAQAAPAMPKLKRLSPAQFAGMPHSAGKRS
jgi:hypothetical protein